MTTDQSNLTVDSREIEDYVLDRIRGLEGWNGRNLNDERPNYPGADLRAWHTQRARSWLVEVRGHSRGDYLVKQRPAVADLFAFVATQGSFPWPVYVVGGDTARQLGMERRLAWPGRKGDEQKFHTKLWQYLLDDSEMAALERFSLLDEVDPAHLPPLTESLRQKARWSAAGVRLRW